MNAEKIYTELKEMTYNFQKNGDGLNIAMLFKLKEELETEIKSNKATSLSGKNRIKKCINYAKKVAEKRPILGYTCNDQLEGYQVYCDSYFAVALNEEDQLPIADYKEVNDKWQYPNIKPILAKNNINDEVFIKFKVNDLLQALKMLSKKESFDLKKFSNNDLFDYVVTPEVIKNFITFLNLDSKDEVTLYASKNDINHINPLRIIKDNGSYGLLTVVRRN